MGLQFSRQNFGKRWMVEPIGDGAYRHAPDKGWAVVVDEVTEACWVRPAQFHVPNVIAQTELFWLSKAWLTRPFSSLLGLELCWCSALFDAQACAISGRPVPQAAARSAP
jgi:hypothetical protein